MRAVYPVMRAIRVSMWTTVARVPWFSTNVTLVAWTARGLRSRKTLVVWDADVADVNESARGAGAAVGASVHAAGHVLGHACWRTTCKRAPRGAFRDARAAVSPFDTP